MPRRALLLAPALALSATLTACAGSEPAPESAPAPPAAERSGPALSPAAAPPPNSKSEADVVVEVAYAGGEVTGADQRIPVKLGQRVVLRFTSDVAEEIHVHGYDLTTETAPGEVGAVSFMADIPGVFEVELEGTHLLIATLVVS